MPASSPGPVPHWGGRAKRHGGHVSSLVANLPSATSVSQGITVTLENSSLWQTFYDEGTEMIITKHGR